jgi:hypothetical protein
MGKSSRSKTRVVQGKWTLSQPISVLRDNVFVGDRSLAELSKKELEVLWTNKIGSKNFSEAVRREVVYRIEQMFLSGIEKQEKALQVKPLTEAVRKATST